MDAAALLKSQGWRGKGHSLHPSDNSIGLSKPLLLSRNSDGRGIGQQKHFTSDQWWLTAFDQKLKGLDTSGKGVVQSVNNGSLDALAGGNGKYKGTSGLYASFVRGGMLDGTMTPEALETSETPETPITPQEEGADAGSGSKKAKQAERGVVEKLGKKERKKLRKEKRDEEKKAKKQISRMRKAARAERKALDKAQKQGTAPIVSRGTKEERLARKAERKARRAERGARKIAERRARKLEKQRTQGHKTAQKVATG